MRIIFTFLLFCSTITILQATHNRAGEITYKQIDDQTVQATIITYTQTSSIPADRDSLQICWGDGQCEMLLRDNEDGEPIENDYKINQYIGTHTYSSMGTYQLSMTDPNRNGSILNVNSPNSDQVQFHLQSTLNVMPMTSAVTNTSPTLLVPPVDVGFVRERFMHTPNAIDLDGDSIAYELVTPLMQNDMPVPNYMQVDEIGAGANNTYSFDEKTGLFVWSSPQIVGQYNIAIKIKAYRDGQLIDMMIRDMQILIQGAANTPPALSIDNFMPSNIKIAAGKAVNFQFTGSDTEDDMNPGLSLVSETLDLGASVSYTTGQGAVTGNFSWEPTENDIRPTPYQVTLKAVDSDGAATFEVVNIQVTEFSTAISEDFKNAGYKLFPNPTDRQAFLEVPATEIDKSAELLIFDNLGRMVKRQKISQMTAFIQLSIRDLPKGSYIIQLVSEVANVSSSLVVH